MRNNNKADKLPLSIEKWYLKANAVISFYNSIAYTTANVQYLEERSSQKNTKENEGMPNKTAKKNCFNDFQQKDDKDKRCGKKDKGCFRKGVNA